MRNFPQVSINEIKAKIKAFFSANALFATAMEALSFQVVSNYMGYMICK